MAANSKDKTTDGDSKSGAGSEAAQGLHAVSGQRGAEPGKSDKGAVAPPAKSHAERMSHPGSEPLEERTTEHESGYGGKGGQPRESADKRESTNSDGSLRSDSNKH